MFTDQVFSNLIVDFCVLANREQELNVENGVTKNVTKSSPSRKASSDMSMSGIVQQGQVQAPVTSAATIVADEIRGPRITSLPPGVTSGVAGPVYLSAGVPNLQRSKEPKPVPHLAESTRHVSPPAKMNVGKSLLPFSIVPPKQTVIFHFFFNSKRRH